MCITMRIRRIIRRGRVFVMSRLRGNLLRSESIESLGNRDDGTMVMRRREGMSMSGDMSMLGVDMAVEVQVEGKQKLLEEAMQEQNQHRVIPPLDQVQHRD